MNGSVAKMARRDLRRAVGVEAVDTINRQAERISQIHSELGDVRVDLAQREEVTHGYIQTVNGDLGDTKDRVTILEAFHERDWKGRLRWLLRGK